MPWVNAGAGNEGKDMVHGQHNCFWSASALRSYSQNIGKLYLVERSHISLKSLAMSRCFPFPPPGYELKGRPENLNSTIKEKKQKKHKDKKDKVKKEKSERKEENRTETEGKHKEDKKRKRKKHRDKKDKKKDKLSSLEEKKIVGYLENQNVEKLVPDSKRTDGIQGKGTFVELQKRVRDDGGATDNEIVRKITLMENRKINFLGKVQKNSNGMLAGAYDDIKNKREHSRMANGQSLKVDARSLGNGLLKNCYSENQNKEGRSWQLDKVGSRKEGKERNGCTNIFGEGDSRKNEAQNKNSEAKDERRKRKKVKKKEKVTEDGKEMIKRGANDGKFLDFHGKNPSNLIKESHDFQAKHSEHKELNGLTHDNGIRPNNMLRPVLTCHQAGQNGIYSCPQNMINLAVEKGPVITNQKVNGKLPSSQLVIKNVSNIEPCQTANKAIAEHCRVSNNNHVLSNGLISSHVVHIERKMEPCQSSNSVAKVKQIVNNCSAADQSSHRLLENGGKWAMQGPDEFDKADNKGFRTHGTLEGKKYTSPRPFPASIKSKEKVDASMKPPHPDLKCLSLVLTVPVVESPQCDDEQWLFGCKDSQTKMPKLVASQNQSMNQVWSEAVKLESADVTALPYVIPY